jgi:hypothetical protein
VPESGTPGWDALGYAALPFTLLLVAWVVAGTPSTGAGTPVVAELVGADGGLPDGWEPIRFSKVPEPTRYSLVTLEGERVLRAESRGGASGLVREMSVDLDDHPRIGFRWKVENVIEAQDLMRKDGDDSPVRLYVLFEPEPERLGFARRIAYEAVKLLYGETPTRSLVYAWATRSPPRDLFPNPYTDLVTTVVVESGTDHVGEWVEVERDVRADYRQAFDEDPPSVRAIAVMTDTDNTGESVTAYYGTVVFLPSLSSEDSP